MIYNLSIVEYFFADWDTLTLKILLNCEKRVIMIDNISLVLVIIGALNWGSIGLFGFDLVGAIFGGQGAIISKIIFTLVGLAGLWSISLLFKEKHANQS